VGLGDKINRKPTELSGGEQQRVATARALINNPAIVLGDEPTGNLDSKTGSEIVQLMRDLNEEMNITFILVTHNPEVANATRRIIHLRDGKIEQDELLP
jgi:putative ABC transport system ATP-binding protein